MECLTYALDGAAGSSKKIFPNSRFPMDCDKDGLRSDRRAESANATEPNPGMRLADFVAAHNAREARLSQAHVLALRL